LPALKKGDKKTKTDDLDFVKREAGQIMTDYIGLGSKFTNVTPPAAPGPLTKERKD
jgi:carboxyl-terminal processing protease